MSTAFNVVTSAISPSLSTVVAAPGTITASTGAGASTITVTVRDSLGNPIPGVTVIIAASGNGNTLGQPSGVTNSSGVATGSFASTLAGAHTVTATAGGVSLSQQPSVTVNPTTPKALVFGVGPSSVAAGASITPAVQVQVQDSFANVVTTSAAPVAVALFNNPGSATLGGTLTQNAASGVATFGDLTVNKVQSGYTLAVTSSGITGAISNAFAVTPGTASQLVVTTQPPSSTTAGVGFGLAVTAQDAQGNVATRVHRERDGRDHRRHREGGREPARRRDRGRRGRRGDLQRPQRGQRGERLHADRDGHGSGERGHVGASPSRLRRRASWRSRPSRRRARRPARPSARSSRRAIHSAIRQPRSPGS